MIKAKRRSSIFWNIKNFINSYELGVRFWFLVVPSSKNLFVNKKTDIVIEGYPRSGNTYCVALVETAAENRIAIARHRHEIGQLKRAKRLAIPVVVVIREPLDSIASFMIREEVSFRSAYRYYLEYYKYLSAHTSDFFLVDFFQLIRNQGMVLQKISSVSGVKINYFSLNKLDQDAKLRVSEMEREDSGGVLRYTHLASPSKERSVFKRATVNYINRFHQAELKKASSIYNAVLECALNSS